MKKGFDSNLYAQLQTEKILQRIEKFNCIWNSAANFLTICTRRAYCPALPTTPK